MPATSEMQILVSLKDMATKGVKDLGSSLENLGKKSNEAALMMSAGAAAAAVGFGFMLKKAGEMEQVQVAFTTLLGSAQKAQGFIKDLQQFAAATPFELPGITTMAQSLLATGYAAERVIPMITGIGNAASALGKGQFGADRITTALTQMASRGQVTGQEMMQLAEVGINGFKLLSEQTGIAEVKLRQLSEKGMLDGKKAVDLMVASFNQKWGGAMENQSKTLIGLLSTLKDNVNMAAASIGNQFLPQAKAMVSGLIIATEKVAAFIKVHQEAISTLIKWTAVIAGAFAAIIMTQSGVSLLAGGIKTLWLAFYSSNPYIFALKLALMAAAAASVYLNEKFGSLGNAFKAISLAFAVTGNVLLAGFKSLGNSIIGFLNSMTAPIGKFYNWIAEKAAKLGVDMGSMDFLHIDFKFDPDGNMAKATQQVKQIDAIMAEAKAKSVAGSKQAASAENNLAAQMKLTEAQMKANADALMKAEDKKKSASKATDQLKESITKIKDEYKNLKDKGVASLQELSDQHSNSMSSIRSDIKKTQDAMKSLTEDFNRGMKSDNSSVAGSIVETEQKIADLKKQIAEETDAKKRQVLQDELDKEQKAYNDNASFIKGMDTEVVEARRRAGLTDMQRAIEDFNAKRLLAQQEYNEKSVALQNELTLLKNKETEEIALFTAKQKQITEMLAAADANYKATMDAQTKMTADAVNAQIGYFNQLATAISNAMQAKSTAQVTIAASSVTPVKAPAVAGKRAFGGPVGGGLTYLVGEKGPELFTAPANGNIVPNDSINRGGITINITGNQLLDSRAAEKMADLLMGRLTKQIRI